MNNLYSFRNLVISVLPFALATCVEPKSIECANDWWCPPTMQCSPDGRPVCLDKTCGDGIINSQSEQCDGDGQGHPGETAGCNINCTKSVCGDGWQNAAAGEQCDGDGKGHGGQTATCNANCTPAKHGDGIVNAAFENEQCDGGNGINCESSICTADCKWRKGASCGDGLVDAADEKCDGDGQGHGGQTATCNGNCTPAKHGDGIVNSAFENEQCDGDNNGHGNGQDCGSVTCNADCTPNRCGDGKPNALAGEKCDDGPLNGNSDCSTYAGSCSKCGTDCQTVIVAGPSCGDGTVQSAYEDCDNEISKGCGTCVSCKNVATHEADGAITITGVPSGSFTLNDDGRHPTTFEFGNSTGNCSAANTCIVLQGVPQNQIAGAVVSAISAKGLPITATVDSQNGNIVNLTNKNGLLANQPIVTTNPSGFTVSGMSGGNGCGFGVQCSRPQDCASNVCTAGVCK